MSHRRVLRFACLLGGCLLSAAAFAQTAFTAKPVRLRAGPSRDFETVAHIGPNVAVQVVGCVDDWTWCDTIAGPERGWAYAGNLVFPYQGQRVTILANGPMIGLPIITFSVGPYWDAYYRGRPWYRRRGYWIGRPPPPHWIGRPPGPAPRPRPPAALPVPNPRPPAPAPVRPRPVRPAPRPPRPSPRGAPAPPG